MKYLKYILLIIVLLLDGYLIYHATLNGETSSKKSEEVTDLVVGVVDKVDNPNSNQESITQRIGYQKLGLLVRKLCGHFGAFMIIAFLCFWMVALFTTNNYLRLIFTFVNGLLIAIITEVIQSFISGRYGSVKDVLIDMSGCLLAMLISFILVKLINLRKGKTTKNEKEYI